MNRVLLTISFLIINFHQLSSQVQKLNYACPPCDLPCDSLTFEADGVCPHCNMNLIMNVDSKRVDEIEIKTGSGNFLIEGGLEHSEKTIKVFYHRPSNFITSSKILIVVPGTGRNGNDYRDAWIKASEKYGVLILAPSYPEKDYDYGAYHMGGLIYDLDINGSITSSENSNEEFLDEENFEFKVNSNPEEWLFNDFDRLFNEVAEELGSTQTSYDLFGHSAGGQILHRFAIFHNNSKAHRILSSNSGAYTLPHFNEPLLFGIGNSILSEEHLKASFQQKLVLFIGELDNEYEQGGLLLRSLTVDKQGTNRLTRGIYFYQSSEKVAKNMNTEFNWKIEIVPNIGHDFRKISEAAAVYLYGIAK